MSKIQSSVTIGLLALALCSLEPLNAQAQRPGTPKSNSVTDTAESAKKEAILASKAWENMQAEFHNWLAEQVVLTPQQVAELKAKLNEEVDTMSAAELQTFLDEWNAKLRVLLGKDAAEAREWLAQNLVVMADGYRNQFLQELGLTHISDMTAAQIEQKILQIRAKRNSIQKQRAAFEAGRQADVQLATKVHAQWQREADQAAKDFGKAPQMNTYQSHYSPKTYSASRYYPAYGGPFGGYGWGSYFW
jgi:hypothetical protein